MAELKDKKITILKHVEGTDDQGFPIDKDVPIQNGENIWAYYRHASGDEIYAAKSVNFEVEAIFRINWRSNVEPNMKILFRGQKYKITQIDDYEGYRKDLKIRAYRN